MFDRTTTRGGAIALWGGIEGTVNRVQDLYFSQLERSGHHARMDDLNRCAALGVQAMRYPVLWERVAPGSLDKPSWGWTDKRLSRLRALGIEVIAGLLHHGSGPRHTSLVDPLFAPQFARYAAMVAQRYPWLDQYTPINEPLTTARFSGWYGIWYPHGRDARTFKDALLGQCRATVLAMREIRRVNSGAQLVQTEDLGKTYSTAALAYQADFNNALRWLAWDMLCGRVTPGHCLWDWLTTHCHASAGELMWFADNPCPPDVIGVNHYVTSERYLDERLDLYPPRYHGGNDNQRYADIEAARSLAMPTGGLEPLLHEAWERYRIPLAVTEVHIDAAREDHLRWIAYIWQAALGAREAGVDLRAVTGWALLGSFDWNCLLAECRGYYEPGAFDIRGPAPRRTAVGAMLGVLGQGKRPDHPVLAQPGWWQRADRFFCPPAHPSQAIEPRATRRLRATSQPIVVSGASGALGRAFARVCGLRGVDFRLLARDELDIADRTSVVRMMDRYQPWAVVNAAGYVRVDEAENDVVRCFRENTRGPGVLAELCAGRDIGLMVFSSDLVFDGRAGAPYVETDRPAPLSVYGMSKAEAEKRVKSLYSDALIIRTSSFFSPWDEHNFIAAVIRTLRAGQAFRAAADQIVTPTYVPDLVHACLDLLTDRETGIWHLTNGHALSWADFATRAAHGARLDQALVQPCEADSLGLAARRPSNSALASARCAIMPAFDDAMERCFQHR